MRMIFLKLSLFLFFFVFNLFFFTPFVSAQLEPVWRCACDAKVTIKTTASFGSKICSRRASFKFDYDEKGLLLYSQDISDLKISYPSQINSGSDLSQILDGMVTKCVEDFNSLNLPAGYEEPIFNSYPQDFLNHNFATPEDCFVSTERKAAIEEGPVEVFLDTSNKEIACDRQEDFQQYKEVTKTPSQESPFSIPSAKSLNKFGTTSVQVLIGRVIKTGMGIIGSITLVMLIYGGIIWMTSHGNAEKARTGLNTLLWAGLGTTVVLASYAIVSFIMGAFL